MDPAHEPGVQTDELETADITQALQPHEGMLDSSLEDLEAIISLACQGNSLDAVKTALSSSTQGSCTSVWAAGAIAYRCRTCQLTASSAVCVPCFKAGNHEGHDFIIYRSPAGGCCDCGDLGSWALEGCCSKHRPDASCTIHMSLVVGQAGAAAIQLVTMSVLLRITLAVQKMAQPSCTSPQRQALCVEAAGLCKWLSNLLGCAPIRTEVCSWAIQALPDLQAAYQAGGSAIPLDAVTRAAPLVPWSELMAAVATQAAQLCELPDAMQLSHMDQQSNKPRKVCVARLLLRGLLTTPSTLLHELTTLLMLQLYEASFKEQAAAYFLDCYDALLMAVVDPRPVDAINITHKLATTPPDPQHPKALGTALDRLTVQLFNSEEQLIRLLQTEGMLHVMLSTLERMLRQVLKLVEAARGMDQEVAQHALHSHYNAYRRVVGDLHNICNYSSVANLLLTDPSVFTDQLLRCLGLLQCMAAQVCIQPGHAALREASAAVPAGVNLELVVGHVINELVSTCQGSKHPSMCPPADLQLKMLSAAARESLQVLCDWACSQQLVSRTDQPGLDACSLYEHIQHGQVAVSPHLPLHRAASMFMQVLITCQVTYHATDPTQAAACEDVLMKLMRHLQAPCSPPQHQQPSELPAVHTSQAVARHILMLQAWLSQIAQRKWVRNDDDTAQVELFCSGWRESTCDLDMVMLMFALAAGPPSAMLLDVLHVMGAGWLLKDAGIAVPGHEGHSAHKPANLPACEDALRLLVAVLRDRAICGAAPQQRIRKMVVHYLTLGDVGHAQLLDVLPHELQHSPAALEQMDQVLSEVAVHRPPSLTSAATYCLRKEAWSEFDPLYLHHSRRTLPKAMERAASAGMYKPHWQLRAPTYPLPAVLQPMQRVLATPELCHLVAYVLHHSEHGGQSHMSEEIVIACLNLLALQTYHLEECVKALQQQGTSQRASTGPAGMSNEQQAMQNILAVLQGGAVGPYKVPDGGMLAVLPRMAHPASSSAHRPHGALHVSHDIQDLAQHLDARCRTALATAHASGLLPGAAASQGIPATTTQLSASHIATDVAGLTSSSTTPYSHPVPSLSGPTSATPGQSTGSGSDAPAMSAADEAKARAKQRQQAMMERMKAQQAAFLQQKSSTKGNPSDNSQPSNEGVPASSPAENSPITAGAGPAANTPMAAFRGMLRLADSQPVVPATVHPPQGVPQPAGAGGEIARPQAAGSTAAAAAGGAERAQRSDSLVGGSSDEEEVPLVDTAQEGGGPGFLSRLWAQLRRTLAGRHTTHTSPMPPHMGTWGPVSGECVVCQASGHSRRRGPLGWISHVGVCACLAAPLSQGTVWPHTDYTLSGHGTGTVTGAGSGDGGGGGSSTVQQRDGEGMAMGTTQVTTTAPTALEASADEGMQVMGPEASATETANGSTETVNAGARPAQRSGKASGAAGSASMLKQLVAHRLVQHGPAVSIVDQQPGMHVHSCGHMMHLGCFEQYRSNLLAAAAADPMFPGYHLLNTARREFQCPQCRRLSNCLLPAAPFTWGPAAIQHGQAAGMHAASAATSSGKPAATLESAKADSSMQIDDADGAVATHTSGSGDTGTAKGAATGPEGLQKPPNVDSPRQHGASSRQGEEEEDDLGPRTSNAQQKLARLSMGGSRRPGSSTRSSPAGAAGRAARAVSAAVHSTGDLQSPDHAGGGQPAGMTQQVEQSAGASIQRGIAVLLQATKSQLSTPDSAATSSNQVSHSRSGRPDSPRPHPHAPSPLPPQPGPRPAKWSDVAEWAYGTDMAPLAMDLASQVACEALQHITFQERAIEARLVLMLHGMPRAYGTGGVRAAEDGTPAAAEPLPAGQMLLIDLTTEADAANDVALNAAVAGDTEGQGDGMETGMGSEDISAENGQELQPPHAAYEFMLPRLTPATISAMPSWDISAAPMQPPQQQQQQDVLNALPLGASQHILGAQHPAVTRPAATQLLGVHGQPAAADAMAGSQVSMQTPSHISAAVLPAEDVHMASPSAGSRPGQAATAPAATASDEQLPHRLAHLSRHPFSRPSLLDIGYCPLQLHGEKPSEARRRWSNEPLTPAVWALLAHNLAHYEAIRRPGALAGTMQQGSSRHEHSSKSERLPGSEVVEIAHVRALRSLTDTCIAVGCGQQVASAAAEQLRAMFAWLMLEPVDINHTGTLVQPLDSLGEVVPIRKAPVCITSALLCEYSEPLTSASLRRVFGKQQQQQQQGGDNSGTRVLCSQQTTMIDSLATDPFLLVLELFALSLTAQGAQHVQHAVSPADLLSAVLQVVLPIAALQAAVWVVTCVEGHANYSGNTCPPQAWLLKVYRMVRHLAGADMHQENAPWLESAAAHLLPFLVRVYVLHRLCMPGSRELNADLLAQYSNLGTQSQTDIDTGTDSNAPAVAAAAAGKYMPCVHLADAIAQRMGVQSLQQALQQAACVVEPEPVDMTYTMWAKTGDQDKREQQYILRWLPHIAWAVSTHNHSTMPPYNKGAAGNTAQQTSVQSIVSAAAGNTAQQASVQPAVVSAPGPAVPNPCRSLLLGRPRLIQLPSTFQDLFLQLADKPCAMCNKVSEHPSLCLVTGRLLCSWWRGCGHNRGGGLLHAAEQCGGSTLALSLKSTKVVCLRPNRLTICQSPYLDAHGEEDVDLRRGRPLFLNTQVYRQLEALWAASATEFDSHMLQSSRVDLAFL